MCTSRVTGASNQSEPCDAEFGYIRALSLEDLELVGEFVHCLRVLGRALSPAEQAMIQRGRELLAKLHDAFWRSHASFYQKYHTAWCIAVGLA